MEFALSNRDEIASIVLVAGCFPAFALLGGAVRRNASYTGSMPILEMAGQKDGQAYIGVWKGEHSGKTFCVLKLRITDGKLAGTFAAGDITVGDNGEVNHVDQEAGNELVLLEVKTDGTRLAFKVRDRDDLDDYELRLIDDRKAELGLLVPANAAGSAPMIKPLKLTKTGD